jgi:NACalpha-BTF3-like transcription factor
MLARLFARQGQLAHANARGFALVSAETVKQLRQRTGAPINKCKQALEAEGGDLEAATSWLLFCVADERPRRAN